MAEPLGSVRQELREALKSFVDPVGKVLTEEQTMKVEASYAASGLKEKNTAQRIKAIEFLEILPGNPYAEEHLLNALQDREGAVVQKAVSALSKVGTAGSAPQLREFLKTCRSRQVVAELSRLLSKLEKGN